MLNGGYSCVDRPWTQAPDVGHALNRRHLCNMVVPAGTTLTMPTTGLGKMQRGSGGGVTGRGGGLHSSVPFSSQLEVLQVFPSQLNLSCFIPESSPETAQNVTKWLTLS